MTLLSASCLEKRGSFFEVGGATTSAREPKRLDRIDAAFVHVEGGRVTKPVRDDGDEIRRTFSEQAGGYDLRDSIASHAPPPARALVEPEFEPDRLTMRRSLKTEKRVCARSSIGLPLSSV